MNKKLILAAFFFAAPSIVSADVAVSTISCSQLRLMELNKNPGLTLVDVRLPPDFAKGHIQGARNIPEAAVLSAALSKSGTLVVYCGEASCPLSHSAAEALISQGYQNVSVLNGGIAAWIQQGYPIQNTVTGADSLPVKQTTPSQAAILMQTGRILIVDVRPPGEFAAGHLPGAQNIPLENFKSGFSSLPQSREILLYDRLSTRSESAARQLQAAGFNVSELLGGVAGWARKGRTLEVK